MPLFQKTGKLELNQGDNNQLSRQIGSDLRFTIIQSPDDLNRELIKAHGQNKSVLLDFYADWCISCKEMEVNTFQNPDVAKQLKEFVLLQADVTKNSADNQALLKHIGLFGPPGILIFDLNSEEQKDRRVIGYMPPQRFLERLKKASEK